MKRRGRGKCLEGGREEGEWERDVEREGSGMDGRREGRRKRQRERERGHEAKAGKRQKGEYLGRKWYPEMQANPRR